MTMEQEMNQLYRKIAETVDEMIPEEWTKFYFYAQISETGGGTYFFYNTSEDESNYKYSLDIPDEFIIDKQQYDFLEMELYKLSKKLRKVFANYQQELWYSFTMSLENTGKFKIHYDYTNWFDTDYSFNDQLVIWKYKYLGIVPDDPKKKELIERYLKEFPDNPI